ncbi:hypothetical protein ACFWPK_25840 [Nocardia sp. NPDC058519]|uniref:hypothetical protein n=1 Tax=unclassified Nocardia TaxID=2637762 RepID=UPI00366304A9
MASTSLPLAAAAAVATLLAAPAGAVPSDQPTTPATPAPAQPGQPSGEVEAPETPESAKPGETKPTPAQPGVTSPAPGQPEQAVPAKPTPSQPGVTKPRTAPLPVPGQAQPAVQPERAGATPDQPGTAKPETGTTPSQPGATPGQPGTTPSQPGATPGQQQTQPSVPSGQGNGTGTQAEVESPDTLIQEPKEPAWQAPRLANAPAAPVVEMEGPRQELGVTIDGAGILANTHHYNNASGYVGTVGYRAPGGGFGDAGVSVEYIGANSVKVTTFNGGDGRSDNTTVTVLDTTQANLAKAAVENWIKAQPGGTAALDAAAKATLPVPGELLQTLNVAGVNTQWGGSIQY